MVIVVVAVEEVVDVLVVKVPLVVVEVADEMRVVMVEIPEAILYLPRSSFVEVTEKLVES